MIVSEMALRVLLPPHVKSTARSHPPCRITCAAWIYPYPGISAYCAPLQGVHMCGELLDVFGRIGGFNFYWAFVSARLAGSAAGAACRDQHSSSCLDAGGFVRV